MPDITTLTTLIWVDASLRGDAARLHTNVRVAGVMMHLDAIAVHDVDGEQCALDLNDDSDLDHMFMLAGAAGPFETTTIGGFPHPYVLTATPHSR
jgi:hypothetical protein